jgi:tripartite-type tricarboxylate transporter receptor subunit TctC
MLLGPAGMSANVVDRLRKETVAALSSPETKQHFNAAGFDTMPLAGAEFEKIAVDEYRTWKDIAAAENIVVDE